MVEALDRLRDAKNRANGEQIAAAQKHYDQICQTWLNSRAEKHKTLPEGFIADRWALDILQRWLIAAVYREHNDLIMRMIRHVKRQAEQFDLIVLPPMYRPQQEAHNEAGLERNNSLSQRMLSHALTRGLIEELLDGRCLHLPARPMSVAERVDYILARLAGSTIASGDEDTEARLP